MAKVTVKQPDPPAKEISVEVLASSIVSISEGIKKLRAGRLTDRALFLLVQNAAPNVGGRYNQSPVSMRDIKAVFEGIDNLETAFIKKAAKAPR